MWKELRAAIVMLLGLTVVTGIAYPLFVWGVAQAAMSQKANGSLIVKDGKVVGSHLVGQQFDDPKYFWGRLSATKGSDGKALPYNGGASVGTNYGPTNTALADAANARIEALQKADPTNTAPIPVDLVTASASGLDPHITPAAALYQAHRVATLRHVDEARLRDLIAQHTDGPTLGFFGEPGVNVLELNMALDDMK
jgi:K+-transporting ATPase ATPase C chain